MAHRSSHLGLVLLGLLMLIFFNSASARSDVRAPRSSDVNHEDTTVLQEILTHVKDMNTRLGDAEKRHYDFSQQLRKETLQNRERLSRMENRQMTMMLLFKRYSSEMNKKTSDTKIQVTRVADCCAINGQEQVQLTEGLQRSHNRTQELLRGVCQATATPVPATATTPTPSKATTNSSLTTTLEQLTTQAVTTAVACVPPFGTLLTTVNPSTATAAVARDCQELSARGHTQPGEYSIAPGASQVQVYCTNGYTVLQRRDDGLENFTRTFAEYEQGFGKRGKDHWLGLQTMERLTEGRCCRLRIEMYLDDASVNKRYYQGDDSNGQLKYIEASQFAVGPGHSYSLFAKGIRTNLVSKICAEMLEGFHSGHSFSTLDKDTYPFADIEGCASIGTNGWWIKTCSWINLNGGIPDADDDCSATNYVCAKCAVYRIRRTAMMMKC